VFKIQELTYLNSKDLKVIRKSMEVMYGLINRLDYVFMISKKNDIYIINNEFRTLDLDNLRANSVGIYFGEFKNNEVRLSIEGSQIVGPFANKNILKVDSKLAKMWMYGLDIPCKEEFSGFVIIFNKDNNDYLGSGRYKENKILNHVPKGRRIHE